MRCIYKGLLHGMIFAYDHCMQHLLPTLTKKSRDFHHLTLPVATTCFKMLQHFSRRVQLLQSCRRYDFNTIHLVIVL